MAQVEPKSLALTDRKQWHKSNRNNHFAQKFVQLGYLILEKRKYQLFKTMMNVYYVVNVYVFVQQIQLIIVDLINRTL